MIHQGITKVQRVEHSARWLEYIAQREEIRKGMNNECLTVEPPVYTVSEARGPDADIPSSERLELDTGVNEVYLWHGTSTEHVDQIIENGFKPSSRELLRYGPGIYLAENSCKAFQYCCTQEGIFAAFLCRVVLGTPYTCTHSQRSVVQPEGYNSVLAASSNQVHREFVIQNPTQVYPEYVVFFSAPAPDYKLLWAAPTKEGVCDGPMYDILMHIPNLIFVAGCAQRGRRCMALTTRLKTLMTQMIWPI